MGKEFNSHRITLVHQYVLHFIVSEVKTTNRMFPESQGNSSPVYKLYNCLSSGDKSLLSLRLIEQATFVLIYKVHNHRFRVRIQHGLWTANYGLGVKDRLRYKTCTVDLMPSTDYSLCFILTSHITIPLVCTCFAVNSFVFAPAGESPI